jgi:hypothetical protein
MLWPRATVDCRRESAFASSIVLQFAAAQRAATQPCGLRLVEMHAGSDNAPGSYRLWPSVPTTPS